MLEAEEERAGIFEILASELVRCPVFLREGHTAEVLVRS